MALLKLPSQNIPFIANRFAVEEATYLGTSTFLYDIRIYITKEDDMVMVYDSPDHQVVNVNGQTLYIDGVRDRSTNVTNALALMGIQVDIGTDGSMTSTSTKRPNDKLTVNPKGVARYLRGNGVITHNPTLRTIEVLRKGQTITHLLPKKLGNRNAERRLLSLLESIK